MAQPAPSAAADPGVLLLAHIPSSIASVPLGASAPAPDDGLGVPSAVAAALHHLARHSQIVLLPRDGGTDVWAPPSAFAPTQSRSWRSIVAAWSTVLSCNQILSDGGGSGDDAGAACAGKNTSCVVVPACVPFSSQLSPALLPLAEHELLASACPLPGEERRGADLSLPRFARLRALMRPTLMDYQRRALEWLLEKEGAAGSSGAAAAVASSGAGEGGGALDGCALPLPLGADAAARLLPPTLRHAIVGEPSAFAGGTDTVVERSMHPMWSACRSAADASGRSTPFYACPFAGSLSLTCIPPLTVAEAGGATGSILGDEMGLGKTVTVLALLCSTPLHLAHAASVAAGGCDAAVIAR